MGTLALPQQGNDAFIRIMGGVGFNAQLNQNAIVELHIRTSNGSSVDGNGYAIAASAAAFQQGNSILSFKIVPNASGGAATQYTIYALCNNYIGDALYTVEASTGSWTPTNLATTDPGTAYVVPFQFYISSNAYCAGTLAVGTMSNDGYSLAVNGPAVFTQATVKTYANWPDYVFNPDYRLDSLKSVADYARINGHLPGVPSAAELQKGGLDLGNMESILMKKVEELTLYQAGAEKEIAELKTALAAQAKRLEALEAHAKP
jgi:hypothetical protein